MRRGIRIPAWYQLLVPTRGILSLCQSPARTSLECPSAGGAAQLVWATADPGRGGGLPAVHSPGGFGHPPQ
jgi:hypothetical protein